MQSTTEMPVNNVGSAEWWGFFATYSLFSLFFGVFGLDRFYKRQIAAGIIKFITFGGCLIWYFIDIIIYGYRLGKTGRW
ncbi:MAG: TM2 domain-containing protein [Dehalococcoidia bacterium]|jgi:TM2 domain-containing membrane protein YozV